jgi:ATP synthase protein I
MPDQPKGREPGHGELSPEDKARFEARVNELGTKLGKAKASHGPKRTGGDALQGRGMGYGFRMASEFVAAILVGGLIGFVLDRWLGTQPWLFLAFFMLGLAAGCVNVFRSYQRMQKEIAAQTGGNIGTSVKDDDEN